MTGWRLARWRPLAGWRPALRVARREARRARGRSALVIAMIALPVAALAFAAVSYDTFELTAAERATRRMGTAQALIAWPYRGPVYQDPAELDAVPAEGTSRPAPSANPGGGTDRLLALLPPGTRAITDQKGSLSVRTAAGVGTVDARMLNYADPLARGILRPVSGRAPQTADEVALTPAATSRVGAGLGDTLRLSDGSRTFRVVAIVEDPDDLAAKTVVLRSGAVVPEVFWAGAATGDPLDSRWLVATPTPLTWAQVKQLNTHGVAAVSRHVLTNPPADAEQYPIFGQRQGGWSELAVTLLVAGLAILEIVLLAGPAFAVGARRRRRDLALVAASGGTPAHVRRIVLADGVVLGVLAAAVGVLLGVACAAAGRPLIEEYIAQERSGGFRVLPVGLAVLAGVAVVTGVLAALVPAWISARQDVVAALAGRRGITRSRRRWLVLGLLLTAAGAAVAAAGAGSTNATLILVGLAVGELGLVLCTPALVGLVARVGRWLPPSPRIALRDTSRNRTAAAPAISAVMAAVVGSLAVGVVYTAEQERAKDDHRYSTRPGDVVVFNDIGKGGAGSPEPIPAQTVAAVRSTMPVDQIYQISLPSCVGESCMVEARVPPERDCPYSHNVLQRSPTAAEQRAARSEPRCDGVEVEYRYFGPFGSSAGMVVVIDETAAAAVTGIAAAHADRVAAALRSGSVVVSDPRLVENGRVKLTIAKLVPTGPTSMGPGEQRTVTAPGFVLPQRPRAPITMLTAQTARSFGLSTETVGVLATTSRMPTVAEQDRLEAAVGSRFGVYVERGAPDTDPATLVVLAIVAGVITLGAAAIATGLAAADGRADLTTLAAVGAAPRVRRALSLSQSGVVAGLGSLLGTIAGVGAAVAVLAALNRGYAEVWPAPTPYPIAVPWVNVGIALVVVPLVAMLGAGLLTRSRLPIERRL